MLETEDKSALFKILIISLVLSLARAHPLIGINSLEPFLK